jgi:hypothetical protein
MMPMMVVPMMVMPMMMPPHLGGLYLGTLLHRCGGDQQSADRCQSQKSRHVHVYSPLGSSGVTPAAWSIESTRAAAQIAS